MFATVRVRVGGPLVFCYWNNYKIRVPQDIIFRAFEIDRDCTLLAFDGDVPYFDNLYDFDNLGVGTERYIF